MFAKVTVEGGEDDKCRPDDEDDAEEFFEVEEEDGEVTPKAGDADSMDCVDHRQTHNNNIISAERLSDKIKALQVS